MAKNRGKPGKQRGRRRYNTGFLTRTQDLP